MEHGMIFDVAHGSFVDGPGVRTVIFFKGCNLRCNWCHNPESQSFKSEIMLYKNKCSGCGICKNVCPQKGEGCNLCGVCTQYCPSQARKICGKIRTVDEVMTEIEKDKAFYNNLSGGVTFSGGECMLQLNFLKALLKRCHEAGIHTAVDTAGNVAWESFEEIIPYTDAFLYDVKCFTDKLHQQGTGVSNKKILDNLKKLSVTFKGDIFIRIPIIPGFNTDEAELLKMATFLKDISCKKTELLPYHKLGSNKYAALGREEKIYTVPSKADMEKINLIFNT